jgi:hypothetical protein
MKDNEEISLLDVEIAMGKVKHGTAQGEYEISI